MIDLIFTPSKAVKSASALCLSASLLLTSCAPLPGPGQSAVATPQNDGTACYGVARVPFYQTANEAVIVDIKQQNAKTASQGVAILGVAATIAGLAAGGRAGNAIAAVGALAAVAGALSASVQTDQRLIGDMSYRFSGLVQCRQDEARQIRADVRARRMTVDQGRDRLVGLRDLMLTDADAARRVNQALAARNQTYIVESTNVDTRLASEPDPAVRRQRGTEVAQARQTIQSNQRALTDQVSLIDRAAQTITVSSIELPPPVVLEG